MMCKKSQITNGFISKGNLTYNIHKSYRILKNSEEFDLSKLEGYINKDFPPIGSEKERIYVVYCYSLVKKLFTYPNGESKVLYIGSTASEKNGGKYKLSYRFKHCKEGKDDKSNICLRHYYEQGAELLLEIYVVEPNTERQKEKSLRKEFLEVYKAFPIADGASYTANEE